MLICSQPGFVGDHVRATRQSRYLQRLAISPLRKTKDFLRRL